MHSRSTKYLGTQRNLTTGWPVLISALALKVMLLIAYLMYMSNIWAYEGFYLDLNSFKVFEGFIAVILIALILPKEQSRPSTLCLHFSLVFTVVPICSLYSLRNLPRDYFYVVTCSFLLTALLLRAIPEVRLKPSRFVLNRIIYACLGATTVIVFLVLLRFNGLPSLKLFDFNLVYEVRGTVNYGWPIMYYVVNWQGIIIGPFLLTLTFARRQWGRYVLMSTLQGVLYLFTSAKVYLLPLLVVPVVCIFLNKSRLRRIYFGALALTASSLVSYFFGLLWIPMLFTYRSLFLPALISFQYHEFFSRNGYVFMTHSIFSRFVRAPIYDTHPVRLIGQLYHSSNFPNTGYFGDAFMNFGPIGVVVVSMLFAGVLKMFDMVSHQHSTSKLPSVFALQYAFMWTNMGFVTSLIFGGFFLMLTLLWAFHSEETHNCYNQGGVSPVPARNCYSPSLQP